MKNVFAVILLILALFCAGGCVKNWEDGFDKYENYYQSETGWRSKNAYVGGDAYNYIINGTYFTAFTVAAAGYGISAVICLCFSFVLFSMNSEKKSEEKDESSKEHRPNNSNYNEKAFLNEKPISSTPPEQNPKYSVPDYVAKLDAMQERKNINSEDK